VGYFTCRENFGEDVSSLFNFITGYSDHPDYKEIVVAPRSMRKFFEKMIKREIENAKAGLKNGIVIKTNALVDYKMAKLLYKASCAGVRIRLIVRGMCCLVPGVKEFSENIEVTSIVGRFLEHSRIFYFENQGNPELYLASADLMPRNLDRRIELAFPVEDADLRSKCIGILNLLLKDNVNARVQRSDTTYEKKDVKDKKIFNSQLDLFDIFKENQFKHIKQHKIEDFKKRK
jgi:polyphosphate kinase